MPIYNVFKVSRSGRVKERLAVVNAANKPQATGFVRNATQEEHVRAYKATMRELDHNKKRIWSL